MRNRIADLVLLKAVCQTVKPQIDYGRGVEREQLAENQSSHNGNAERTPQLRARAGSERQGQATEQRRHGGHHDRAKAEQTRLKDRFLRRLMFFAFRFESEIDHHNRVLFYDADQEDDADQRNHRQIVARDLQSQNRASRPPRAEWRES